MAVRHEEKYLIDYRQYLLLRQRATQILTPDTHGHFGSYVITSLYFDDPLDNALYEKLDGLPEHSKFRIRTYDYSDRVIKLERKDKHGILTEKCDAPITKAQIALLDGVNTRLSAFEDDAYDLAVQIQAQGLQPKIAVRYRRDAFFHPGSDFRLTFDTELESIGPDMAALFDPDVRGLPVLDKNCVVMEIKYGAYIPAFARKLTSVHCKQLSVSKYALCREKFM